MHFYEHDRSITFDACQTKILHDSLCANALAFGNQNADKDAIMVRQLERLDALTNNWVELQDIIVTDIFGVRINRKRHNATKALTMLAIKWFSVEEDTSKPLGFGVHIHTIESGLRKMRETQVSLQTTRPGADERTKALFHDLQEAHVRHFVTKNRAEKTFSRPIIQDDMYRIGNIISALDPISRLDPLLCGRELLDTETPMRRN